MTASPSSRDTAGKKPGSSWNERKEKGSEDEKRGKAFVVAFESREGDPVERKGGDGMGGGGMGWRTEQGENTLARLAYPYTSIVYTTHT